MALLTPDGSITTNYFPFDHKFLIIQYPGAYFEDILFQCILGTKPSLVAGLDKLFTLESLTERQRFEAAFWMGYFYFSDIHGG